MLSFIIPTRDRPEDLSLTLERIGRLDGAVLDRAGGAEVVVVDNDSRFPPTPPGRLANGVEVRVELLAENIGAAARNVGAERARGSWLIMLDDDSHPLDAGLVDLLRGAPHDIGAIGAEILLPEGGHEWGGLPEVFIGCGVAIRRHAFLELGGYDATFGYYAEEYDLAARTLLAGLRVTHSRRFRVLHRKVVAGRDMNAIVRRLVRNNMWVVHRYAPASERDGAMGRIIERYSTMAVQEDAQRGFEQGLEDVRATLAEQPPRPMSPALYDRFTGLAHARAALRPELLRLGSGARVAMVARGKNAWVIRGALDELGAAMIDDPKSADAVVVGTLSPGPILDATKAWRDRVSTVLAAWRWPDRAGTPSAA